MPAPSTFRFDKETHTYTTARGKVIPNITTMLEDSGWIDTRWYTQAGRDRGADVHDLTADYDLGVLDLDTYQGEHRPRLLAYREALRRLQPVRWTHIEQPFYSVRYGFAGTPDRVGLVRGMMAVPDTKSGAATDAEPIQTALQALLVEDVVGLPARAIQRFTIRLLESGKFQVDHHRKQGDIDEALRIIGRYRG